MSSLRFLIAIPLLFGTGVALLPTEALAQGDNQVLIEARFVEISTDFSRDLGTRWGVGAAANGIPIFGRNGRAITTIGKTFTDFDNQSILNFNAGLQVDLAIDALQRDPGIQLVTIPRVTPYVTFELEIETAKYDAQPNPQLPSPSNRQTETGVVVGGGGRIVIGGLSRPQDDAPNAKLPIMADIALLGRAFDRHTKAQVRLGLVILLRPTIIKSN